MSVFIKKYKKIRKQILTLQIRFKNGKLKRKCKVFYLFAKKNSGTTIDVYLSFFIFYNFKS